MTHDDEREARRMIQAGHGWQAVADRFCGELRKKSLRERAIDMDAIGVDRDAIAICLGKSESWVTRTVDAEQYRKHLERNAAWKRQRRGQQTQSKREWRKRMKAKELEIIERLTVALETLPQRLEPVLRGCVGELVESIDQSAALTTEAHLERLGQLTGALRKSIEGR